MGGVRGNDFMEIVRFGVVHKLIIDPQLVSPDTYAIVPKSGHVFSGLQSGFTEVAGEDTTARRQFRYVVHHRWYGPQLPFDTHIGRVRVETRVDAALAIETDTVVAAKDLVAVPVRGEIRYGADAGMGVVVAAVLVINPPEPSPVGGNGASSQIQLFVQNPLSFDEMIRFHVPMNHLIGFAPVMTLFANDQRMIGVFGFKHK